MIQKTIKMTRVLEAVARHPELKALCQKKIDWLERLSPWDTSGVEEWFETAKVSAEIHMCFIGKPYGPNEQQELSLYVGIEFADELEPFKISCVPCMEGMKYTKSGLGVIRGGKS